MTSFLMASINVRRPLRCKWSRILASGAKGASTEL